MEESSDDSSQMVNDYSGNTGVVCVWLCKQEAAHDSRRFDGDGKKNDLRPERCVCQERYAGVESSLDLSNAPSRSTSVSRNVQRVRDGTCPSRRSTGGQRGVIARRPFEFLALERVPFRWFMLRLNRSLVGHGVELPGFCDTENWLVHHGLEPVQSPPPNWLRNSRRTVKKPGIRGIY
jgi:hypothetical protein